MLLSICIPSYNRFEELEKNLISISKAQSNDFDVWVIDNVSKERLNFTLNDSRIHYVYREESVSSFLSIRTCLDFGNGDYKMLCLDKDFIIGEELDRFLEQLKKNSHISCGYCILNSHNKNGLLKISKYSIDKQLYHCYHPSGYFFRKDIVKWDSENIDIYSKESVFFSNAFNVEFVYAKALTLGYEGCFSGRLIETESLEKARNCKSFTYSTKKDNVYFLPNARKKQMNIFIQHMDFLNLEYDIYKNAIRMLCKNTMLYCTIWYSNILKSAEICEHNGVKQINISLFKLLDEAYKFSIYFRDLHIPKISKLRKIYYLLLAWLYFLIELMKNFLHKLVY